MASRQRQGTRAGWVLAALAAATALSFALLVSGAARDARAVGPGCGPYVDARPGEATARQMRKALRCLVNEERVARDRRAVRTNRPLARIAKRHTRTMVEENCFTHQCPGERPLRKRIESSAYMEGGGRYGYAENLGCSTTPQNMIEEWMSISFHRENILERRFRHVGIGAKRGSPFPPGSDDCMPARRYMTYTVIVAWRKPKN